MAKQAGKITTSSTAEYFAKNLQQVGFSSLTKAVLTTLKEAVDNALDACEENGIAPELMIEIEKLGNGNVKNSDRIRVRVEDNGPGIAVDDVPKVFGEYLASSKFGRGRCSRGQQGIGISAATTWAQLTTATGARVITKTANMRKAVSCVIEVDIRNNKGVVKEKETIDWDRPHGTSVEFVFDGRLQLNGEAGLLSYLNGTVLVNPHMTLTYKLPDQEPVKVERVATAVPSIPPATEPHPHTMKLGEFIAHSHLFGRTKVNAWFKNGFSRLSDGSIAEQLKAQGLKNEIFNRTVDSIGEEEFRKLFTAIQNSPLKAPSTSSVLSIGEEGLAKSIQRIGEVDFFAVVTRKPAICDFKPVQVEVAIARLKTRSSSEEDEPVQVLRFANRVPLQFDKAACAIVQAINTVNWRAYGLGQPKRSLPLGPYIIAVSVVSPFIKFKNASKETIDASEELVEEIRRALIQGGQRLSRHIKREHKANELEQRIRHIEQFGPILVEGLARIVRAPDSRKEKARQGLLKILGRDAQAAEQQLAEAETKLEKHLSTSVAEAAVRTDGEGGGENEDAIDVHEAAEATHSEAENAGKKSKKKKKSSVKKKESEVLV